MNALYHGVGSRPWDRSIKFRAYCIIFYKYFMKKICKGTYCKATNSRLGNYYNNGFLQSKITSWIHFFYVLGLQFTYQPICVSVCKFTVNLELVSKELNHFGVIADLFRQIGGHSSWFVLFCSFWRLFTIKMIKSVKVFPFSFWKIITFFFYFIKFKPPA